MVDELSVKKRKKGTAQRDSSEMGKVKGEHMWWRELGHTRGERVQNDVF